MKYGIAIFPTKKLQDMINSYRKRYDPYYTLIPPHLTLKRAFEASDDDIQMFIKEIHKIASRINPFPLHVYKIGSFHPVNNVIYGKVENHEELTKLHEALHTGLLHQERTYPFVPHITIAQDLSDAEHSDVLESLKMKKLDYEEVADRFQLLYQLDNGSWTVYETFHLGVSTSH